MREITPIFKSNASLGRSILPPEKPDAKDKEALVSIYDIVKKYKLKQVCILDDSTLCLPSIYKDLNEITQLVYGINFVVCQNVKDRSDESRKTESKITVYMKGADAYEDFLAFHNGICGKEENFYYQPRADWDLVKSLWTKNLGMVLPAYDNFLHNNLFLNFNCIPDFGKIKPIFTYADMGLPFDYVLSEQIKKYAAENKLNCQEVHPVYYYSKADFKAYTIFRCIENRSKFSKPDLGYFSSDEFCWESYCSKAGVEFLK